MMKTIAQLLKTTAEAFLSCVESSGLRPNQITLIGFLLVISNCAFYVYARDALWLGVGLALSFAFDSLDGVIARRTGQETKFGSYLDAVVDRNQEFIVYITLAWATRYWFVIFLVATGSFLISYNKARAAIEVSVDNKRWPDLMERPIRLSLLCGALILDQAFLLPEAAGEHILYAMLVVLAALTHFTALQRFMRARSLLVSEQR